MSNTTEPLDEKTATEIGGALARYQELKTKAILETSDAAEQRGLESYLTKKALEYLPQLLGAWFGIRTQYRPLVQGFAALIRNAGSALGTKDAATEKSEQK